MDDDSHTKSQFEEIQHLLEYLGATERELKNYKVHVQRCIEMSRASIGRLKKRQAAEKHSKSDSSKLAKKKVVTAVKKSVAVNSFTYAKRLIFSQLQN